MRYINLRFTYLLTYSAVALQRIRRMHAEIQAVFTLRTTS